MIPILADDNLTETELAELATEQRELAIASALENPVSDFPQEPVTMPSYAPNGELREVYAP